MELNRSVLDGDTIEYVNYRLDKSRDEGDRGALTAALFA